MIYTENIQKCLYICGHRVQAAALQSVKIKSLLLFVVVVILIVVPVVIFAGAICSNAHTHTRRKRPNKIEKQTDRQTDKQQINKQKQSKHRWRYIRGPCKHQEPF